MHECSRCYEGKFCRIENFADLKPSKIKSLYSGFYRFIIYADYYRYGYIDYFLIRIEDLYGLIIQSSVPYNSNTDYTD